MPELPEVQRVVDTVSKVVIGSTFARVNVRRADIVRPCGCDLSKHLVGRRITSVDRRGKRIVFTLDSGERFYIHLGMTGRLTVAPPGSEIPTHTHAIFTLGVTEPSAAPVQLRFRDPRRFGGIFWLGTGEAASPMGPEPLTLSTSKLAAILSGTTRTIKVALLDQRLVAGLGNIYVDESLFAAGIHPTVPANKLNDVQIQKLNRSIKQILRRAIRHGGSTLRDYVDANGKAGAFQRLHRVYDQAGKPCANCRTAIVRIVLGGRSTHFCPKCQPPG